MGRTRSIMGVKGAPVASRPGNPAFDDGLGARKRVFIPGYSGCISRMQETIAGTFAQNSRESHYLVYHGCKPTMEAATLPAPDCFYARAPNPRIKTNAANRSNFQFGDERDWGFETLNESQFKVPTKIPPRHASILPNGPGSTKEELDSAYVNALNKIGVGGVKRLELSIRMKIEQRTAGGPMALRKAFKYFDADASGDIDPDEFYAAMRAFGLEFTEEQVLALFGYYDVDRDGGLSYYEFIDKVLDSGFGNEISGEKQILATVMIPKEEQEIEMKSTLTPADIDYKRSRMLFKKFDANGSGEIDTRELGLLIKALGLNMGSEEINNAMVDLDKNLNGAISFDEFWDWFQYAAVIGIGSSGSPMRQSSVKLKQSVRSAFDQASALENERDAKGAEDVDAQVASINRPTTATPARSKTKMGSWISRTTGGSERPQTAMEGRTGRSAYARKPFGSDGWRSMSRSDFRPPTAKVYPPKLNLPSRRNRPMSAQPLIRVPGAPHAPLGSTSGFRL